MSTTESTTAKTKLIPVTKWNEYHPWPPIGGLRHLIFNENKNNFSKCVTRIGRRVLIDEELFFKWAKQQQEQVGNEKKID